MYKYIVGSAGALPVTLCQITAGNTIEDDLVTSTFYYLGNQAVSVINNIPDQQYFFLHDRLGSVRQVIDTDANVRCLYTYDPYGNLLESDIDHSVDNHLMFTGQHYDSEIDQYYLRARQYCPTTARFTG